MISSRRLLAALLIVVQWGTAFAGQELARIPIVDAPPGTPGLGGGLRFGNRPYVGVDAGNADLVPLYLYEGKYLFAHGTSGGIHAFRNDTFSLDLIVRFRFDRLDPDWSPELAGLIPRHQTLDGGISGNVQGRFGRLRAEWVADLDNKHNGQQADLSYSYPFKWGNFSLSPFATLIWQDEDLTGYYYGVSPAEAAPGRPAYKPGDALNLAYGVQTSWQITDHIFLFGNVGFEVLDNTIKDSPIVDENLNTAAFIGAGFLFGDAKKTGGLSEVRADMAESPSWSWRVNYGYTGEHNIVPEPMMGNLEGSKDIDTNILGLTLGRVLQSGKRVDFWGKFAFYRHLEEPFQDDFWNFTGYVMATGKGYLPWSNRPAFRWGFGLGASYAQKVPVIEQIKQEQRNSNTSHFLNYLEWSVDVPIDGIIKSKLVRNCFVGVTVMHRSGIFNLSNLLGDVFGGADWYTVHLECLR